MKTNYLNLKLEVIRTAEDIFIPRTDDQVKINEILYYVDAVVFDYDKNIVEICLNDET